MRECIQVGVLSTVKGYDAIKRVYSPLGISPTVVPASGGGHVAKIEVDTMRIRKLTERECLRLQGFSEDEIDRLINAEEDGRRIFSRTSCYAFAGNSVVVDVFQALIENVLDDWRKSNV